MNRRQRSLLFGALVVDLLFLINPPRNGSHVDMVKLSGALFAVGAITVAALWRLRDRE